MPDCPFCAQSTLEGWTGDLKAGHGNFAQCQGKGTFRRKSGSFQCYFPELSGSRGVVDTVPHPGGTEVPGSRYILGPAHILAYAASDLGLRTCCVHSHMVHRFFVSEPHMDPRVLSLMWGYLCSCAHVVDVRDVVTLLEDGLVRGLLHMQGRGFYRS